MYKHNRRTVKKNKKRPVLALGLLIIIVLGATITGLRSIFSFPVLAGQPTVVEASHEGKQVTIKWPKYGQSAVGAKSFGVLETSSNKKAQPTASVAKVMTALAVLEKHPLQLGEQGPMIKITEADEALFGEYWAKNGTSVRVAAGEEISLYQALQYILIPSANNIADTTAVWAFGSMEEYTKFANEFGKSFGMENSNFADGSGFSPKTTSTASDLVKLGIKAMENPVIAEIVRTWEIDLPDGNKAQNSNVFLDYNGNRVIGIKTGDTDQAGGVYLTAAEHEVNGQTITIVAAVMGAKTLRKAEEDAMKLLDQSKLGFSSQKIIDAGEVVGVYEVPWQGKVEAVASNDIEAVVWSNKPVSLQISLNEITTSSNSGQTIGEVTTNSASAETINLVRNILAPTRTWLILNNI